ncbi:hypothetical protein [Tianweitania sp.]|uniref:hypothetical protein n=1 Tax=Tianweitania sp. TaxID=2021634 RepID=UPI00289BC05A|nr:hypothetical protein [Tianweitania sp.]
MKHFATAVLIAPLWGPALLAAYAGVFSSPSDFMENVGRGAWITMAAGIGAAVGYVAMLLIGLPTHALLRKRELRSPGVYLASWFVIAVAIWGITFVAGFASDGLGFALFYLAETIVHRPYVPLSIGFMWGVVGVTFQAIIRSDRTAAQPPLTDASTFLGMPASNTPRKQRDRP